MKKRLFKFIMLAVTLAVSASLMISAFPPYGQAINLVVALSPMLVVSRLLSARKSAWTWFAFGMVYWLVTLSWMISISKNGGPLPLVILGEFGLALACSLYFAMFGYMAARYFRATDGKSIGYRLLGVVFVEPVLWAGIEFLRGTLFTGFAWNFLGNGIAQYPSLALSARFGGAYLVSALVVLINGVFATLFIRAIRPLISKGEMKRESRVMLSLETALPLLTVLLFVFAGQRDAQGAREVKPFRVAMIQADRPCVFEKDVGGPKAEDVFLQLAENAKIFNPDLLVLAESAFCEVGDVTRARARNLARALMDASGAKALAAGGDYVEAASDGNHFQNVIAVYGASATNELGMAAGPAIYAKRHLVPFGEYIPFDKAIPCLVKLSPIGITLYPGERNIVEMKNAGIRLAPLICFEDTFSPLARASANEGAQLIVIVTNDSWFSFSCEAEQHSLQAVMRAIETGLPIVRCGNSGVTGIVDSKGNARWLSSSDGGALVDDIGCQLETVLVPVAPRKTLYVILGDWPLIVLFAMVVFLLVGHGLLSRRIHAES